MFETILKIILTVSMIYLAANTFFKYQVSMDRIMFLTLGVMLILCLLYYDTNKVYEFILTISIIFVIGVILKIVSIKRKKHGYFLFNVYVKHYLDSKNQLYALATKYGIDHSKINYHMCKPWLVIIKDTHLKTVNKMIKDYDSLYAKAHKKITMYNYWYVVAVLVLITALWRF